MLDPTPSSAHSGETPLLQTIGLTKRYGDFLANDSIDIEIWPAEIHALLGENGAGKSTLVKIIYGLMQPSDGEMRWQGEKMVLSGPSEARARGIGMVFQHFSLFDNLTVAENVALGLDGKESFTDMSARLEQVSNDYGLPLDPKREVWQLSVGERQRIEIVRALMQNPKFLILDEPTAVLTPQEADQLFIVLERLKAEGRAMLYISHKLEEVKRLCDTATILRGGKKISTCNPQAETASSLARMMVGAEIKEVKAAAGATNHGAAPGRQRSVARARRSARRAARTHLAGAQGWRNSRHRRRRRQRPGRIVRRAVRRTAGPGSRHHRHRRRSRGSLSITQRRRLGAAFVPEERLGHGTAPRMKLSENALLTGHAASGMVQSRLHRQAGDTVDRRPRHRRPSTCARPSAIPKRPACRAAICRSSSSAAKSCASRRVLVVSQPTWGVDAGAAAVIRQALLDLAGRGAAVLVISQDLDELAEIADRIAVMFHGRLSEPLPTRGGDAREARPVDGRQQPRPEGSERMQLVLERRAERSTTIALVSPLIAIGADARHHEHPVCDPRQEPDRRARRLFHRAADRRLFAAGNRREGDAAGDDRDRPVALLSRQCLEHRRRGSIPDRRGAPEAGSLSRRKAPTPGIGCCRRCWCCGALGRRAVRPDPGDLQGEIRRQRNPHQPDAGLCRRPVHGLSGARTLARSARASTSRPPRSSIRSPPCRS